jgi:hypothetical protein
MPRQIIDTESGRPAYERRVRLRWGIVIAILILAAAGITWYLAHRAAPVTGLGSFPGNAARMVNLGPVPAFRRDYAA